MTTPKPTPTPTPWYRIYAKAIVGGIEAGIAGAAGALLPALIAGAPPTEPEWWTALGLGLAAALGVGLHVSKTSNS